MRLLIVPVLLVASEQADTSAAARRTAEISERMRVTPNAELTGAARHGWPVDIECAYHAGILYLLQCRPVTTLAAAD